MNAVRPPFTRVALLVSLTTLFVGCSSINELLGKEESIDYKSAGKGTTGVRLEVPPDLTRLSNDSPYQMPAPGSATYSSYSSAREEAAPAAGTATVLPERPGVKVMRDGNQRWLVVEDATPDQLYPIIKSFWQDHGFLLREDAPERGVMETDWAENRAKIPQDFLRNTIGRVFDSLWSTGERDMFRTRLERGAQGTEVYITHRGAIEELVGAEKSQATWTTRPNDPGLEAEFLVRLMARLGEDEDKARTQVEQAQSVPSQTLAKDDVANQTALALPEPFVRAWRRVGLALDRGGFTVEDRNRSEGTYYVRYIDVDAQAKESKGILSKWFGPSTPENSPQYRIRLQEQANQTLVSVLNAQGAPEQSATGRRILNVLNEQLK